VTTLFLREDDLWLGTDGGGIIQLSLKGELRGVYGIKDGLLMSSVRSFALFNNQLWIGFGSGTTGGIGYLDLKDGTYVGLTTVALLQAAQERPEAPPIVPVTSIRTADKKTLWIATATALKRFDIDSAKWSTALPFAPTGLSVDKTFVAAGSPTGGVMICELSGSRWENIPLSKRPEDNHVSTLRVDGGRLWLGDDKRLRHLDLGVRQVIGEARFDGGTVRYVAPEQSFLWFVADGPTNGTSIVGRFGRRPVTVLHARDD